MRVEALDHVNIRTPDVTATAMFMSRILDMPTGPTPGMQDISKGAWIYDSEGRAIVHLTGPEFRYPWEKGELAAVPAGSGRLHHVALKCVGYTEICDRLQRDGIAFETNNVPQISLRQIFLEEPNGILLELNFSGD